MYLVIVSELIEKIMLAGSLNWKSITHDPEGSGLVANGRVQVLVD